jgi:hypothetical protein
MDLNDLQLADRKAIQVEVDAALDKLNANAYYHELLWTESLISIASVVTVDFPDVERVVMQYLDDDAAKLMPFVKFWKLRHKADQ